MKPVRVAGPDGTRETRQLFTLTQRSFARPRKDDAFVVHRRIVHQGLVDLVVDLDPHAFPLRSSCSRRKIRSAFAIRMKALAASALSWEGAVEDDPPEGVRGVQFGHRFTRSRISAMRGTPSPRFG